ncbi:MAG: DUF1819 family protein [Acidimicrobiia bacterium]|nr:DUF1819 family protein [Acidimicrobiia bacterium]
MTEFTTRIIKGGALLAETRRLLEVWDESEPTDANLDRIRTLNLLGLPSRKRTEDTLQILRQRFVDPAQPLLSTLRMISRDSSAFRDTCYFEATRNDDLLAFVAENVLFDWWEQGRSSVTTDQLERTLLDITPDPDLKAWGDATRRRVVHGLLSALRDFGVLKGRANKHLAPPHLTIAGFAYVTARLRHEDVADIPTTHVWRRWLLDEHRVRALFLEADRIGLLRYSEAGSVTRLDWIHNELEEIVRVAV